MDIEKLISEVFKRTPLWDKRDQNHHNRFILDKKWDEVAEHLNTTRAMVRNKWKALRDKFRTTLSSIPKTKSGDAAYSYTEYKKQWKYYENLLFLKDQFIPRNHDGNFKIDVDQITDINESEPMMVLCESNITPSSASSSEPNLEGCTPSSSFSSRAITKNLNLKKKRSFKDEIGAELLEVERKKLKYLEEKKNRKGRRR
ncbi:hypothetical protein ABEB36_013637 [Hypothenemus hampei]|uniref:MADF domain-containing protein n=1 Tax=Hypothenemus hampei TaxID=57062 RepID=A0ABD1E9C4_HYPHA